MKQINTKLIYFTTATEIEAENLARLLVGERLVACVNIIGPTTSMYQWKDELKKSREFVGIAKTSSGKVEKSIKRIIELHSYECPAAVVIDIEMGNNDFISWIHQNVN